MTDRRVYIVDFSLPAEDMRAIRAEAAEVVWLDHHASVADVHKALGWGVLDTAECGTSLAWKTLFPGEPPPPVVAYIKDKDLWRWELPDSRAIAAGMEQRWTGDDFDGLLSADLAEMARLGRPALDQVAQRVAEAVTKGVVIEAPFGLAGVRALALKAHSDLNAIGEHACLPVAAGGLGLDLAIMFYQKRRDRWVHSLRSVRIDCAAIARVRGGGGHPSAACYVAERPIVEKG